MLCSLLLNIILASIALHWLYIIYISQADNGSRVHLNTTHITMNDIFKNWMKVKKV